MFDAKDWDDIREMRRKKYANLQDIELLLGQDTQATNQIEMVTMKCLLLWVLGKVEDLDADESSKLYAEMRAKVVSAMDQMAEMDKDVAKEECEKRGHAMSLFAFLFNPATDLPRK